MVDNICKYLMKKIENQIPDINEERKEVIMYGLELIIGGGFKTNLINSNRCNIWYRSSCCICIYKYVAI